VKRKASGLGKEISLSLDRHDRRKGEAAARPIAFVLSEA